MASSPEELALELSQAVLASQTQTESQLREKAAAILGASSIVVPVAALAVGKAPATAAVLFALAAVGFFFCVRECAGALLPSGIQTGVLGGQLLDTARSADANLPNMQESAAKYMDLAYANNADILAAASGRLGRGIRWLTVEVVLISLALIATVLR
jgi:hypothetical protein